MCRCYAFAARELALASALHRVYKTGVPTDRRVKNAKTTIDKLAISNQQATVSNTGDWTGWGYGIKIWIAKGKTTKILQRLESATLKH